MSSDERHTRAHSDSFLSSSGNTSLDDLAQLNNELLIASATADAAAAGSSHSAAANRLLPPKQKKRTPVFSVFEKATNAASKQGNSGRKKNSGGMGSSQLNRHIFYSSDDSVCGIPKPSSKINSSRLVKLIFHVFFCLFIIV